MRLARELRKTLRELDESAYDWEIDACWKPLELLDGPFGGWGAAVQTAKICGAASGTKPLAWLPDEWQSAEIVEANERAEYEALKADFHREAELDRARRNG